MHKLAYLFFYLTAFVQSACGQNSPNRLGHCQNPRFDREVAAWLSFKVPAIDVDSLHKALGTVTVLDAREPKEYAVSHIPGAVNCGYDRFDLSQLEGLDKTRPIVVYCSIGYRSEKIAQKLTKAGFTNVSNLYGSIFEWANRGYPMLGPDEQPTARLHTYNRSWGRWVTNPSVNKTN
jgi:rhodanese-related sulfurtransferase